MKSDLFEGIAFENFRLASGEEVRLPLRYAEWNWICAGFFAPAKAVAAWMPTPLLKPVLSFPSVAMVHISAFEYKRPLDLEPYNELAVTTTVQYDPAMNIPGLPLVFDPLLQAQRYHRGGIWIQRLPVTTQEACTYGKEIWGFPKSVEEIRFEETSTERTCHLLQDGCAALSLTVRKIPTRYRHINYHVYSAKGNELLRTPLCWDGQWGVTLRPGGARLTLGEGPIAEELRGIGLGKRAFYRVYTPHCQSLLPGADERIPL